jgi:O-antigen/teichoic acid export membrane protein
VRFFRDLAGILLTRLAVAPISVLTSVLLARWLSPEDRGLYAVCVTFAATLTVLVQFGWPSASIYRLRSVGSAPAAVAAAGLCVVLALSTLAVGASVALEPIVTQRFLDGAQALVFYLVLATVPFRLLGVLFGGIARGIDRFRYENWYIFSLNATTLVALAGVLIVGDGALAAALWAVALVYVLTTSGLVLTVLRQTGLTSNLEVPEVVASARFGLKAYYLSMSARLHEQLDIFVLAYLAVDPAQIAYFAVAKGLMRILDLVPSSLHKAAFPQLAGLSPEDAAAFAAGLVRQGIVFVLPASLALGACARFLLPAIYGPPYAASVVPFVLLLPCVLFITIDGLIGRFFNATNQHAPIGATRTAAAFVNVGLNFWWIPSHGIVGAASAACASFALQALLAIVVFLARTDSSLGELTLVRRSDVEPYLHQVRRLARRSRG